MIHDRCCRPAQAFGSWMHGGAYATKEELMDPVLNLEIYRSEWLPLCNLGNGARFVTTNSTAEFLQECENEDKMYHYI